MNPHFAHARALLVTAATLALVAGCSSSSKPAASTSSTPSGSQSSSAPSTSAISGSSSATTSAPGSLTTASAGTFCAALGAYGRQFKTVLAGGQLAAIKLRLPPIVSSGQGVAAHAPTAIKGDVVALASDVSKFNTYIQTEPTQQTLDGKTIPPEIAKPVVDLQVHGSAVKTWYGANCHGVFGS